MNSIIYIVDGLFIPWVPLFPDEKGSCIVQYMTRESDGTLKPYLSLTESPSHHHRHR